MFSLWRSSIEDDVEDPVRELRTGSVGDSRQQRQWPFGLCKPSKNLLICFFHTDLCFLWVCNYSFISLKSVWIWVVYNWHNEFGVTFSPCFKWLLIESEGGVGVREVGLGESCVGWGPTGDWVEITAVKMAVRWKRGLIALGQRVRGSSMLSPIRVKKCSYQEVMAHLTITQAQNCSI